MTEDDSSFLTIILESHPGFWNSLQGGLNPKTFVEHLLLFLRTYLFLNDSNQLTVFGIGPSSTSLLYATPNCALHLAAEEQTSWQGRDAIEVLHGRLIAGMTHDAAGNSSSGAAVCELLFSNALSRAMCYIHRVIKDVPDGQQGPQPRVLCISSCPDVTSQYIAVMNAIFAAQRSNVLIDGCNLGVQHSSFLQQAAHLTGGVYVKPAKPEALVQYLMTTYTAAASTRQFLRLPKSTSVDFRASCFCHKRPIDTGFVCSVCLSIFCSKIPQCTTCQTRFIANSANVK